jgi:hypothetical protein
MPGAMPEGLKAKLPQIEQEKRDHAAKQAGASSQPAPDHAH